MNSEVTVTSETRLSRSWFLRTLLHHLTLVDEAYLGSDVTARYLRQIALSIARGMEDHFRAGTHPQGRLTPEEFSTFLVEVTDVLGASFVVTSVDERQIVLVSSQCPWADSLSSVPTICHLLTGIYEAIAERHFGYARAVITHDSSSEHRECRLYLHLRPETGEALPPKEPAHGVQSPQPGVETESPLIAVLRQYQQELQAARGNHENLRRFQEEMTERLERALEAERAASEQMCHLNRLKQDFLSNVSHELRTPITTVQGYVSLFSDGMLGETTPEQREALSVVQRNLDRLTRMVNDLLEFSATSRGECMLDAEVVEIGEVLADALQRVAGLARMRQIVLERHFADCLGCVYGDRGRLRQVFEHLLENAIKFSEPGERVTVQAYPRERQVVVEISDTGIGMTEEQLTQVFNPFVQGESGLSRRYGGMGMGLSLIQNLVELHGGEITLRSTPGEGTVASVTFPLKPCP